MQGRHLQLLHLHLHRSSPPPVPRPSQAGSYLEIPNENQFPVKSQTATEQKQLTNNHVIVDVE
jgi:hypothetical protein